MNRLKYVGILFLALALIGCKSSEQSVQTWDKSKESKSETTATPGQPKQAKSMSEDINNNPNIPDAAKQALGTK